MSIREENMTSRRARLIRVAIALVSIPIIAFIHFRLRASFELHPFFLLPIIAVTWHGGAVSGVFAAIFSAASWALDTWLLTDMQQPWVMVFNEMAHLVVFLIVVFLVARWKAALEREKKLSLTDALTGLSNYRSFFEICNIEMSRARRYQYPLTVIFFDIDAFKTVNDTLGHTTGNDLLSTVAKVLLARCRAADISARLGGDEFAIMLPETASDEGKAFAEMLRQRLLDAMHSHGWSVTFSIGVASFKAPPDTVEEFVAQADELMYLAKHDGKNRIKVGTY